MKKEYLKPTIDITTLETETLMAASINTGEDGNSGSANIFPGEGAGNEAMSIGPKYDVWGFDEEE